LRDDGHWTAAIGSLVLGLQTRPFVLYPSDLSMPAGPIIGAAALHDVLKTWRGELAQLPAKPEIEVAAVLGS